MYFCCGPRRHQISLWFSSRKSLGTSDIHSQKVQESHMITDHIKMIHLSHSRPPPPACQISQRVCLFCFFKLHMILSILFKQSTSLGKHSQHTEHIGYVCLNAELQYLTHLIVTSYMTQQWLSNGSITVFSVFVSFLLK